MASSSWRRSSTCSTPFAPSVARPHSTGRPTHTAVAPVHAIHISHHTCQINYICHIHDIQRTNSEREREKKRKKKIWAYVCRRVNVISYHIIYIYIYIYQHRPRAMAFSTSRPRLSPPSISTGTCPKPLALSART